MNQESRGHYLDDDTMFWVEDDCQYIGESTSYNFRGLKRMSYFDKPLSPHAEWALSLNPGDKVLTNWNSSIPEYASELPWQIDDPDGWAEVAVRRVWTDKFCGSGVLVSLEELPDHPGCSLDSTWIKPLEESSDG